MNRGAWALHHHRRCVGAFGDGRDGGGSGAFRLHEDGGEDDQDPYEGSGGQVLQEE